MWDAVWDAVWDANKRRRPEIMAGRLHAHVPSRDPLPWTSRRAEGSPGPLGRPVLEGPALSFDLLLSLPHACASATMMAAGPVCSMENGVMSHLLRVGGDHGEGGNHPGGGDTHRCATGWQAASTARMRLPAEPSGLHRQKFLSQEGKMCPWNLGWDCSPP
jgi:hypothetical protein